MGTLAIVIDVDGERLNAASITTAFHLVHTRIQQHSYEILEIWSTERPAPATKRGHQVAFIRPARVWNHHTTLSKTGSYQRSRTADNVVGDVMGVARTCSVLCEVLLVTDCSNVSAGPPYRLTTTHLQTRPRLTLVAVRPAKTAVAVARFSHLCLDCFQGAEVQTYLCTTDKTKTLEIHEDGHGSESDAARGKKRQRSYSPIIDAALQEVFEAGEIVPRAATPDRLHIAEVCQSEQQEQAVFMCYVFDENLTSEQQDLIEGMNVRVYKACDGASPHEYVFHGAPEMLDLLSSMLSHMQQKRRFRRSWP